MAETIISIDIQEDLVTGVLLNITHKTTVIEGCGVTSLGSRPMEEAVVEIMNQTGFHDGICRISFSADFRRNSTASATKS